MPLISLTSDKVYSKLFCFLLTQGKYHGYSQSVV